MNIILFTKGNCRKSEINWWILWCHLFARSQTENNGLDHSVIAAAILCQKRWEGCFMRKSWGFFLFRKKQGSFVLHFPVVGGLQHLVAIMLQKWGNLLVWTLLPCCVNLMWIHLSHNSCLHFGFVLVPRHLERPSHIPRVRLSQLWGCAMWSQTCIWNTMSSARLKSFVWTLQQRTPHFSQFFSMRRLVTFRLLTEYDPFRSHQCILVICPIPDRTALFSFLNLVQPPGCFNLGPVQRSRLFCKTDEVVNLFLKNCSSAPKQDSPPG